MIVNLGNYRTGETNSETKYKTAFFNALHDLKAAVRYFRKDLYTDNKFFIDENKIFTGGWSAGAQIGLYNAYVNSEDELFENIKKLAKKGGNDLQIERKRVLIALNSLITKEKEK